MDNQEGDTVEKNVIFFKNFFNGPGIKEKYESSLQPYVNIQNATVHVENPG